MNSTGVKRRRGEMKGEEEVTGHVVVVPLTEAAESRPASIAAAVPRLYAAPSPPIPPYAFTS